MGLPDELIVKIVNHAVKHSKAIRATSDYDDLPCPEEKIELLAPFQINCGSQKLGNIAREEYYKANTFLIDTDPDNIVNLNSPHATYTDGLDPLTYRVGIDDDPADRKFIRHLRIGLEMLRSVDVEVFDYGPGWRSSSGMPTALAFQHLVNVYPRLQSLTVIWKCDTDPLRDLYDEDDPRMHASIPIVVRERETKLTNLIQGLRDLISQPGSRPKHLTLEFEQSRLITKLLAGDIGQGIIRKTQAYTGEPIEFDASGGKEVSVWEIMDLPSTTIKFHEGTRNCEDDRSSQ